MSKREGGRSTPFQKIKKKWFFDKSWRGRGSQNILSKIEALYFVWFNTQSGPTKGLCVSLTVPLKQKLVFFVFPILFQIQIIPLLVPLRPISQLKLYPNHLDPKVHINKINFGISINSIYFRLYFRCSVYWSRFSIKR